MKNGVDIAVADLVARIRDANRAYYDEDSPVLDDVEYDEMLKELRKLAPEHPVLNEIGNPTFGEKYEHKELMGSLAKCHTPEEVVDKFKGKAVTRMPKVDGCSLSLHYLDGVLQMAVTRGDGKTGEIVTANAARILNVPNQIEYKEYLEVRGEAYIAKSNFYGVMDQPDYAGKPEGLKNPRNAAAGGLRQKNPAETAKRMVEFVAYKALNVEHIYETQQDTLAFLERQDFQVVDWWSGTVEAIALEEQLIERIHDYKVSYETDGVVIMIDDLAQFEDMGLSGKCPKGAIAYKFETEKETSKVLDIEWETSRTGKIKPVAVIEPTEICGSTVARITMNNCAWLIEHDVSVGDTVLFEKANEIIPHLLEVLERVEDREYKIPKECPSCGERTYQNSKVDLTCTNEGCPAQGVKLVRFILETLQIKGIGESTIDKLADLGFLHYPWHIFELTEMSLMLKDFGRVKAKNMVKAITNVEAPAETILAALGIEGWGERMFGKLFEQSLLPGGQWIEYFKQISIEEPIHPQIENHIGNMGKIRSAQLFDGLRSKHLLLAGLLGHVTLKIASTTGHLAGATYCITGTLSRPRNQIKADIKEAGGVVKDSITKTLDFLVAGERAGSKLQKAADAGVEVITEAELYAQIEG